MSDACPPWSHWSAFGCPQNHLQWCSTIQAGTLVISLLLYPFFCIYFVTWYPVPITYHVYTSWSRLYFCSSSSSINSLTIVSSTQTKNLVVLQFHLCVNLLLFPLWLHWQLSQAPNPSDLAFAIAWQHSHQKPLVIISYLWSLLEIMAQGHRKHITR